MISASIPTMSRFPDTQAAAMNSSVPAVVHVATRVSVPTVLLLPGKQTDVTYSVAEGSVQLSKEVSGTPSAAQHVAVTNWPGLGSKHGVAGVHAGALEGLCIEQGAEHKYTYATKTTKNEESLYFQ